MTADILVTLGHGADGRPVFMFAGSGGNVRDLLLVALGMGDDRPILGIEALADMDGRQPDSIDAVVRRTIEVIRRRQPQGPYDLIGYSLGGLVALETARQLRVSGAVVGLVGLIDPVFERRFWPIRLFLASQLNRAVIHLASLSRRRFTDAAPEFVLRARRLLARLAHRTAAADDPDPGFPKSEMDAYTRVFGAYRPRAYAGPVHLFHADFKHEFGCDPVVLWRPFVGPLKAWPVPGDHRSILRDPTAVALLASHLTDALAQADTLTAAT
jgi:thioesterase domain-containing protein